MHLKNFFFNYVWFPVIVFDEDIRCIGVNILIYRHVKSFIHESNLSNCMRILKYFNGQKFTIHEGTLPLIA